MSDPRDEQIAALRREVAGLRGRLDAQGDALVRLRDLINERLPEQVEVISTAALGPSLEEQHRVFASRVRSRERE